MRAKLFTGGEQAGKSLVTSKDLGSRILWGRIGWVVAPDYRQAQHEMEYMLQDFAECGLLDANNTSTPKDGSWRIMLKGGIRIQTLSAQDTATIAGEAPDVVALVEAGQTSEEVYYRCLGRTAPKRGHLLINGTLEGSSGWFPELADRWKTVNPEGGRSWELPSWSNESLYPGGWDNEEIQRQFAALPEDRFWERFGGRRTPPRGLVFRDFDRFTHVRPIQLGGSSKDPRAIILPRDTPLQVWIDPGYAGGYAVLFAAVINDIVYIVDEIYTQQMITEQVIKLAHQHPQWRNVTHCVMDVAGEQHQAMQAPAELWRASVEDGGGGLSVLTKRVGIRDGIERLRSFLHVDERYSPPQPKMILNSTCQKFVWELSDGYRYPLDRAGTVRSELPEPRNNHAINACWYGLVRNFGLVTRNRKRGKIPRHVPAWERTTETALDRARREAKKYADRNPD